MDWRVLFHVIYGLERGLVALNFFAFVFDVYVVMCPHGVINHH